MKAGILMIMAMMFFVSAQSQSSVNNKKYKIIIQMTNGDSSVHKGTLRQINNALTAAPNSKIEVVCHSAGINMLQTSKSTTLAQIGNTLKAEAWYLPPVPTPSVNAILTKQIVGEAIIAPQVSSRLRQRDEGLALLKGRQLRTSYMTILPLEFWIHLDSIGFFNPTSPKAPKRNVLNKLLFLWVIFFLKIS